MLSARATLVVLLLLVSVGVVGALQVEIQEDVTALLPGRDNTLVESARKWGLMKKVLVVIGPAAKAERDGMHDAIDRIGKAASQMDGVARVTYRMDTSEQLGAAERIARSGAALFRPDVTLLDQSEIALRLKALKQRLASPEAIAISGMLLADPLGFGRDGLMGLEGAAQLMGTTVENGHLISSDGRFGLIVVELGFDPMAVSRSAAFVDALDGILSSETRGTAVGGNPPLEKGTGEISSSRLEAFALGGPHFVVSSASTMNRDIMIAFGLTGVLVMLIFFLFFRQLRTLPLALLPGGIGILTASGVMGFLGVPLHALTLGFSATITGISVDYVIHLLHRATFEPGVSSAERMKHALATVSRPILLGCLTTVGSFAVIALSGFTGIRQIALFSLISLPTALVAALWLIPPFHGFALNKAPEQAPSLARRLIRPFGRRGKIAVVIGFTAVLSGAGGLMTQVRLSGDPRALGSVDHELKKRQESLKTVFPGISAQAVLTTSGTTLEDALQRNDALYRLLRTTAHVPLSDMISIATFLPAQKSQRDSRRAALKLMARSETRIAFDKAGFAPGFFDEARASAQKAGIDADALRRAGLGQLLDDAIVVDGDTTHVLTRVKALADDTLDRLSHVASLVPGARLISERLDAKASLSTLQDELIWMLSIWLVAAMGLLTLVERDPRFGMRAVVPALVGVVVTVGAFGLLKRPLTPVASAGLTLVMGLGIDYGIFMQAKTNAAGTRATAEAVMVSALTTVAAFGVLAVAETRAMADLGLIILIGVSAALATALLLVPILTGSKGRTP